MTSAIAPALTEETVFRFGIVHGANELASTLVGLATGSLPFGILHLVDRFSERQLIFNRCWALSWRGFFEHSLLEIWPVVGRFFVDGQHILHAFKIFLIDLWNAPHFLLPRSTRGHAE